MSHPGQRTASSTLSTGNIMIISVLCFGTFLFHKNKNCKNLEQKTIDFYLKVCYNVNGYNVNDIILYFYYFIQEVIS